MSVLRIAQGHGSLWDEEYKWLWGMISFITHLWVDNHLYLTHMWSCLWLLWVCQCVVCAEKMSEYMLVKTVCMCDVLLEHVSLVYFILEAAPTVTICDGTLESVYMLWRHRNHRCIIIIIIHVQIWTNADQQIMVLCAYVIIVVIACVHCRWNAMLVTTRRVMVSSDLLTSRHKFSACHSSGTSLAADGVKYAFQAPRLLNCSHIWFVWFILIVTRHSAIADKPCNRLAHYVNFLKVAVCISCRHDHCMSTKVHSTFFLQILRIFHSSLFQILLHLPVGLTLSAS